MRLFRSDDRATGAPRAYLAFQVRQEPVASTLGVADGAPLSALLGPGRARISVRPVGPARVEAELVDGVGDAQRSTA